MNNNTTFQQPFELVTQKFLSKIKYGELTVKFPSGSIKNFKGNDCLLYTSPSPRD